MLNDYYAILDVAPSASPDVIRSAYRRKAFECHPDRGGSHARMILVNEAWEVLSNPETRREYDLARTTSGGLPEEGAFAEEVRAARSKASQYPRDWTAFESWLDGITRDFANVEYGKSRFRGAEIPTAQKSISGVIFANVGGALGVALAVIIIIMVFGIRPGGIRISNPLFGIFNPFKMGFVFGGYILGVWTGVGMHRILRDILVGNRGFRDSAATEAQYDGGTTKHIVVCTRCGQKLRVPRCSEIIKITCKRCCHSFSYPKSNDNRDASQTT